MQNATSARKLFADVCWESFNEQQTTSATELLQACARTHTLSLSLSLSVLHTLLHTPVSMLLHTLWSMPNAL